MEQKNLPKLIIALAFSILVVGILSYLIYFKPKQEREKIKIQKENLENVYKDVFGEPTNEKSWDEMTEEEKMLKKSEEAYQKCFDKTEKLNKSIDGRITNEYVIECGKDGIDNWGNNWEFRFVKWLVNKHSDFCNEFDNDKIKYFLDKKSEELGVDFQKTE